MSLSFKIHLINDNLEKKNKHKSFYNVARLSRFIQLGQLEWSGWAWTELIHKPTHYPL